MYNNSTQYPSGSYQNYQHYQQDYGNYDYHGYSDYNQQQNSQQSSDGFPSTNWSTSYPATTSDPVAQEMHQQRSQLVKQREDYVKKVSVLRHELEQLRVQKRQLSNDVRTSSNRELANILKQNDKLQEEIQGQMKAILNVIEMLSGIIKDEKSVDDLEAALIRKHDRRSHSPLPSVETGAMHRRDQQDPPSGSRGKYCYVHYDAGLHWCRTCDEFPETAKDLLLHLQEKKHRDTAKESDVDNTPWHKLPAEEVLSTDSDLPKKRVPIKGLQFFISAPSWYCKLCDVWIGDLHCASHHLKSITHYNNYENFILQNPHWEMEWLKDREKAKSRGDKQSSDSDDSKRRKKKQRLTLESLLLKEKKKKKRSKRKRKHSSDSSSSSSSSDSSSEDDTDRSKSIRVAMRNMKQVQSMMEQDVSKWNVLEKLVEEHKKKEKDNQEKIEKEATPNPEDPLINQWMTVSQPQEKDKLMLESLKDRMRQKHEVEKVKIAEVENKRLEKEREEKEIQERRDKALRLAKEADDLEKQRREQEELEKIINRDQVKFKANYRRKYSPTKSDDEDDRGQFNRERSRRDSENRRSKSRSNSQERKLDDYQSKKKPQSGKKLPFIGRMPLFKNKKPHVEEKEEKKEIQKESYEPQRRTRFQPGNLAKAYIPKPDVVCFPKLSSIPPLTLPPPPTIRADPPKPPEPPKITNQEQPEAPPPPKIEKSENPTNNLSDDEVLYADQGEGFNANMMSQYYHDYNNMMYINEYSYTQEDVPAPPPPPFTKPLEPPPLPPDDDLAMLGICADDMAAQTF